MNKNKVDKPEYWTAESTKEYRKTLREKAFSCLGNKCARCSETDFDVLQVDHIYGCSPYERREISQLRMFHLIIDGTPGYQLLCANCNWKKKKENNEVRGINRMDDETERGLIDYVDRKKRGEFNANHDSSDALPLFSQVPEKLPPNVYRGFRWKNGSAEVFFLESYWQAGVGFIQKELTIVEVEHRKKEANL